MLVLNYVIFFPLKIFEKEGVSIISTYLCDALSFFLRVPFQEYIYSVTSKMKCLVFLKIYIVIKIIIYN